MKEEEILELYKNGKSINFISKNFNIPYRRVQKILVENQVTIRGGRKKKQLNDFQLEELKKKFEEGESYKDLSEDFNLDPETIRNFVTANNFTRKNNNTINKRIKSDYFSIIDTPQKAYFIGLLYTDGSVDHYRKTGRIRLQLQKQDLHILETFKEELCLDCKITEDNRGNGCYGLEFTDEQIFNDLSKFGIIPQKTYKSNRLKYDSIPSKYLPAYVLGLMDGDGSINDTDPTLNFTTYFESVAGDCQNLVDSLINKEDHSKLFFTTAWHCQWRGKQQVLKILDLLYSNCPISLNRKKEKYLSLKNSLK